MRINGFWLTGEDEETRPVVAAKIESPQHGLFECDFLIDTGADTTVIPAELVRELALPTFPAPRRLGGVGGVVDTVQVHPHIRFMRDDGGWISIRIECYALVTDGVIDLPVLGRDVLNLFSLIVDRPGDVVCFVGHRHRYVIEES